MSQRLLDFDAPEPEETCPGARTISPRHAWVYAGRERESCLKCGAERATR